jgi:hypothetical protein
LLIRCNYDFFQGDSPKKLRSLAFDELKRFSSPANGFESAQGMWPEFSLVEPLVKKSFYLFKLREISFLFRVVVVSRNEHLF